MFSLHQRLFVERIRKVDFLKFAASQKFSSQNEKPHGREDKFAYFGFQKVAEKERDEKIHKVFEDIAKCYDLMGDVLTLGIHRLWKDYFVQHLGPTKNTKLLDLAGGTGDIAFRFLDHIKTTRCEEGCHVVVLDIHENMLNVGKERCKSLNYDPRLIAWKQGDAENLPFDDESFDACSASFAFRNITRYDKALKEVYRVLKPGGRFVCLEFSHVYNPTLKCIYDQLSFQIVPVLGDLIVNRRQAYQYLVESIRKFPDQENFKSVIEQAGFRGVYYENLTFGIVAIHTGFKI